MQNSGEGLDWFPPLLCAQTHKTSFPICILQKTKVIKIKFQQSSMQFAGVSTARSDAHKSQCP